jgi:hypothetical protein
MKVICVSNKGWERLPLTIGEMYHVINIQNVPFSPSRCDDSGPFYKIKGDNGEERYFDKINFRNLTLDEERELKLNELDI